VGPIEHYGLFYRGQDDYLTQLGSFIQRSLSDGFPVVAALPEPNLSFLRGRFGAAPIEWIDMGQAGRNPGRILPGVVMAAVSRYVGRRLHFIGEPMWPGRSDAESRACATHEALINQVLPYAGGAVIVCPYDAQALSPQVLSDAEFTHPAFAGNGHTQASALFDPYAWERFNVPLDAAPADAASIGYQETGDLASVRDFVALHGLKAGLPAMRTAHAVQAANELAANTLQHTVSGGLMQAWAEGGTLVLQANDYGQLPPLAGRIPPANRVGPGNGLILVNVLCDLVRTYVGPSGTSVRLFIRAAV
jgi:hypothetical protein